MTRMTLMTCPTRTNRATSLAALGAAALSLIALTACGGGSGTASASGRTGQVASLVTASPAGSTSGNTSGTTSATTATGTSSTTAAASGGDTASQGQSSDEEKRPQLRLDSTPEEITKLRMAYATCLKDHGAPDHVARTDADEKAETAARKACENKMPLLPPEMDPQRNPHYADAVRKQVKCMKDRGLKVSLVPSTTSDPNNISWRLDSMPGEDVPLQDIQDDCRIAGFGGGRALAPGPA
ncbi:hypothetical protein JOL79_12130 [Microbispora sp. RL4-1S]|uniref:Lipoprotein n=1 Tax=Microbispora oryzae TaxID=2806554 RepID=A0A941AJV1_9ACTN|nr:hypothetical protein [Microbispora oryzae]MBP2704563.1 hypothetical protein [Microbispora oryzae]